MGSINWSFNLRQFVIALAGGLAAGMVLALTYLIRRHRSPELPSAPLKAEVAPPNTLNRESRKNPDNKPNERRVSDGINQLDK